MRTFFGIYLVGIPPYRWDCDNIRFNSTIKKRSTPSLGRMEMLLARKEYKTLKFKLLRLAPVVFLSPFCDHGRFPFVILPPFDLEG